MELHFMDFVLCLVGTLAPTVIKLNRDKNKVDGLNGAFYLGRYWKKTWDDWLAIVVGGVVLLLMFNFVWQFLQFTFGTGKDIEVIDGYQTFCGAFGLLFIKMIDRHILDKYLKDKDS